MMAMKTPKLFLVGLLCATTVWAEDYNVGTDSELRTAIQDNNANITVTSNIDLSNSTLSIPSGATVTIDLGGHTLDRGLKAREYNTGGQVITVRKGATLNLTGGTLKGGWGGDDVDYITDFDPAEFVGDADGSTSIQNSKFKMRMARGTHWTVASSAASPHTQVYIYTMDLNE